MSTTEWLIQGIVPKIGLTVVGGKTRKSKTTVAVEMAISVASGTRCFGTRQTRMCKVYAHLHNARTQQCAKRLQRYHQESNLELIAGWDYETLESICAQPGYKLVVIQIHEPSLHDLQSLRAMALTYGVAIIVHTDLTKLGPSYVYDSLVSTRNEKLCMYLTIFPERTPNSDSIRVQITRYSVMEVVPEKTSQVSQTFQNITC